MARVPARHRPYYRPVERLSILELRAARGWSRRETARRFLLEPATVAAWVKRLDEDGDTALIKPPEHINRLPDLVRHLVKRLKVLCPTMGKKRIAQTLARAGLALAVSTVGRMLKEEHGGPKPAEGASGEKAPTEKRGPSPVRAKEPNHIWQLDLTMVPTAAGFWTAWFPFSVVQIWPFCWWVACVVDHYSRRVMGCATFTKEPKSADIQRFLGSVASKAGARPKYIVSDKGRQFDCRAFRGWCDRRGIQPRYASTGSLRATAVVERFIRSLKDEWLRRITVPLSSEAMRRELALYAIWFETHRPHQGLDGRTPLEVYQGRRQKIPARAAVDRNRSVSMVVHFFEGRKELPIVELKQAA